MTGSAMRPFLSARCVRRRTKFSAKTSFLALFSFTALLVMSFTFIDLRCTEVTCHREREKTVDSETVGRTANDHCHLWKRLFDANSSVRAQIKLDPSKFLYPGLIWGPNNQIVGLWQSIYLAIRLNRTVVLPMFYEHKRTLGVGIPPEQFIDVERLGAFVSIVPIESFRTACRGSFHVVLKAMENTLPHFLAYKRATGMDLVNIDDRHITKEASRSSKLSMENWMLQPHLKTFPDERYEITYKPWLSADDKTLNRVYNTSAPCALYSAPFQSFRAVELPNFAQPLSRPFSTAVKDEELYWAVIDSVRRPPAVVEAAKRFINEVYGRESYVAVHWRFDKRDWRGGEGCERFAGRTDNLFDICLDLPNITAADVATGIVASLDKDNVSRSAWRHVYVTAVPKMRAFADDVEQVVRKLNEQTVATKTPPLSEFIDKNYGTCLHCAGWKSKKETLAMIEMELLAHSEWLFYARHSTFSSNAQAQRWKIDKNGMPASKYERSVLDVADAAYKDRITRNAHP